MSSIIGACHVFSLLLHESSFLGFLVVMHIFNTKVFNDRGIFASALPLLDIKAPRSFKLAPVFEHLQFIYVMKQLDVAFYVAGIESGQFVPLLSLL
jgi:hypothetical protein